MVLFLVLILHLISFSRVVSGNDAQFYDSSAKLGFALSTASNGSSTDLLFQISAPQSAGWGAVGIGEKMDGSLMFIMYPSTRADQVTLSVRSTSSHNTPSPISATELSTIDLTLQSSSIVNSIMTANIICRNCNGKSGGASFNPTSTKQPWIWATGPGGSIASDSQDANIYQHNNEGVFYVDMTTTKTNSSTTIPTISGTADINAKPVPSSVQVLIIIHAICLGGSFIFLFPLGIVLLRWFNKVRFHWMMQIFATTACILGLILAIVFSAMDPEYNTFNEGHQIIGIIAVVALVVQAVLGYQHHQGYKKYGQRTFITHSHLWFGRVAIVLGMVNAILGFSLASSTGGSIAIAVVVVVMICTTLAILWLAAKRNRSTAIPANSNSTDPSSINLSAYKTLRPDIHDYNSNDHNPPIGHDGNSHSGYPPRNDANAYNTTPPNGYRSDVGVEQQAQGRVFV